MLNGSNAILQKHATAQYELLMRKGRKQLLPFILANKFDYIVNWHHHNMAEVLDKFNQGKIRRLMAFMPPQVGKTEMLVRQNIPFNFGLDRKKRIAAIAYNQTRANKYIKDIKRVLTSPYYRQMFPDVKIGKPGVYKNIKANDAVNQAGYFEIVDSPGFCIGAGIDGSITGETIDIVVIDDPYKNRTEADSPVIKKKVYNFYIDAVRTRLHNESQEVILNTRWAYDDLSGKLLEEDGIYDPDTNPDGWVVISYPAIKVDPSQTWDPRQIGEALWPEKHSLHRMLEIKKKNSRTFACLYQQDPEIPGGNIIKDAWLPVIRYSDVPKGVWEGIVDVYVDCAETDDPENDYTGMLAAVEFQNDLYIIAYDEVLETFSDMVESVFSFAKRHGDRRTLTVFEPKSFGGAAEDYLTKHSNLNCSLWDMPKGSKLQRWRGVESFGAGGRIKLVSGPWVKNFKQKCMRFDGTDNGINDEPVDTLVMAATEKLLRPSYVPGADDYGTLGSI